MTSRGNKSDTPFGSWLTYRDLTDKIAARYGFDFDHTTVWREVKRRQKRRPKEGT